VARELLARVDASLALAGMRGELRASEIRFQTVLDASPAGLTLLAAERDEHDEIIDFRWVYLNRPAQEMVGQPLRELLGRRITEGLPGNSQKTALFDSYVRVVETGATRRSRHRVMV